MLTILIVKLYWFSLWILIVIIVKLSVFPPSELLLILLFRFRATVHDPARTFIYNHSWSCRLIGLEELISLQGGSKEKPKAYLQENLNFTNLYREQDKPKISNQTPHQRADVKKLWHIRGIQFWGGGRNILMVCCTTYHLFF